MKSKFLFVKALLLLFFSNFLGYSQQSNIQSIQTITQNVVPNTNASVTGTSPFQGPYFNSEITYQLLIAASELTNLSGKNLVSISFRNTSNSPTSWPSSDATFLNYDIYIGQSVSPVDRTLVFGLNAIGLPTQVRSGNLIIPQNALSIGSSPNSFSYDIPFQLPYFYSGGNLLVEIRHYGTSETSRRVDSVLTTDPGYGTLYSACWYPSNTTSSNSAFEDSFSVINFKAEDVLSSTNSMVNNISIYPNPTSKELTVNSNSNIKTLKLYNLLGQIIFIQEPNLESSLIDLTTINKGTYLLVIENEFGTETKKIHKN